MTNPHLTGGQDLRIGFLLLNKITLAAFSGLIDALRLAADDGGKSRQIRIGWHVMSHRQSSCVSSCGVRVETLPDLHPPEDFDYLAICGGNSYSDEYLIPAVSDYIKQAHGAGVRLLGVCTGSFAIARVGLTDGRTYCVHWNVLDAFTAQFPTARTSVERIFIDEGDIITCAGSTAAIDLGLYLIARHCGRDRAQQAMRHMMLTSIRSPSVPQAHFMALPTGEAEVDIRVRKALHFMEQQIDHPPNASAIARYCGVSLRQLERLFQAAIGITPVQAYRRMRLNYGRWLLDNSSSSVTEIAYITGFSDTAHFSREFTREFATSPRRYRSR